MKLGLNRRHSYILVFLTICLVCFSAVVFLSSSKAVKAKEQELEQLNQEYEEISEQNGELSYLLNDADEDELFEKLARSRGYAYPDEKIYYDITPGN